MSARTTDLADTVKAIGMTFDQFQARHEAFMAEHKTTQAEIFERLENLEAKRSLPGRTAAAAEVEHKRLFDAWLRRPRDAETNRRLTEFEQHARKAMSIGSVSDGGYAVPEVLLTDLERLEKKFSPVRNLVRVVQVGSSDCRGLVNLRGMDAGWVGESGPRTETGTAKLREVVPTFGELYAYPRVSEWLSDDGSFDLSAWIIEEIAQSFAEQEGEAVIRGNGSSKPTGMLNTTPTSRDDFDSPIRAAAAYQYIDDGDSPSTLTADLLIALVYKLNAAYRANGTFIMNSATAGAIRKLKDSEGRYVWQPAVAAGQPETLLGYQVSIWEQMDDIPTNGQGSKFPIAFGDFRRGYLLADRVGVRVTVDASITSPGYTKFFVRRRVGGIVLNNDAIKWIKLNA